MSVPTAPPYILPPIERSPKVSISSASIESFSLTLDSHVEDPFNIVPSHLLQRSSISSVEQAAASLSTSAVSHRRNSFDSVAEASPKSAERMLKKHCSYDTLVASKAHRKDFFQSASDSDDGDQGDDDPLGVRRKDVDVKSLADFFRNTGPELLGPGQQAASQTVKKNKLFSFFKKRDRAKSESDISRSRSSTFTFGESSSPRGSYRDKPLKSCLKKFENETAESEGGSERAAISSLSVALAAYNSRTVVQQPAQNKSPHSRIVAFNVAYYDISVMPNGSSVKRRQRKISFASFDDLIDEKDMVMDSKAKVEELMEKDKNGDTEVVVNEEEEEEEEEEVGEEKNEDYNSDNEVGNSEYSETYMEADDEFSRAGSASFESAPTESTETTETTESDDFEHMRPRSPPPQSPPSPIGTDPRHNLEEYGLMDAELSLDPLGCAEFCAALPDVPRRRLSRQTSVRKSVRHVQVQTEVQDEDASNAAHSLCASSDSSITVLTGLSTSAGSQVLLDTVEDIEQLQEAYFELEQKFKNTEDELRKETKRRERAEIAYKKAREKFDEVSANAYQTLKLLMEEKRRLEKDIYILRRQVST